MRAITIRQPWAWAIIHAGKDVENRSRNIAGDYRGPIAIHAGLTEDDLDYDDPMGGLVNAPCPNTRAADHNQFTCHWCVLVAPRRYWDKGFVIGVVDLLDVHRDPRCDNPEHAHDHQLGELPCSVWAQPDHHHLVFANPRALADPIPAKGRLGLWHPDDELTAAIDAQLEQVTP